MKNFTIIAVISILAFGLVVSGCSGEKELLVQTALVQADSISALQRNLQWQTDSLQTALVKLSVKSAALDSQMAAHASVEKRLRNVSARLSRAQHDYERLEATTEIALTRKDSSLTTLNSVLVDTSIALAAMRSECAELAEQLREETDLIQRVRPWYYKWRHDATERNFVEVLFGSDKSMSPDYPEPEPDLRMLEAVPDTGSTQAISVGNAYRGDD